MNAIIAAITLFSIVKLMSYAVWTIKKKKNKLAAFGLAVLDIGLAGCLVMEVYKICI